MIYLLLSIVFNALIFLLFKWAERFRIKLLPAIIINYLAAATLGFLRTEHFSIFSLMEKSWLPGCVLLGLLFISIFYLIGLTAQKVSPSIASIANKMSVILPTTAAIFLYRESLHMLKVIGIILALPGIFFTTQINAIPLGKKHYAMLPLILFISNGFLDTLLNYIEKKFVSPDEVSVFVPTIFMFAFLSGLPVITVQYLYKKESFPDLLSIVGGVILGVINYLSILFFVKSLKIPNWESSVIFPMNNIGIVITTLFLSLVFFKEKFSPRQIIGIFLCLTAILLIAIEKVG